MAKQKHQCSLNDLSNEKHQPFNYMLQLYDEPLTGLDEHFYFNLGEKQASLKVKCNFI